MKLNITTSHLNNFLSEILYPQQSFAEILQHVQQDPNGIGLEIVHVGHVLNALNSLVHKRLFEFAHCAESGLGEIYVDQSGDPDRSQTVGSVYLSAASSPSSFSEDFHTDAHTEHLSAGNSSVQNA